MQRSYAQTALLLLVCRYLILFLCFELFFCELAGFAVVLVSWIFYLLTSTSNSCMARIFDEIVLELIDS